MKLPPVAVAPEGEHVPNLYPATKFYDKSYTPGPKQQHLLEEMSKLVNELSSFIGLPITVGSGLRSAEDVVRLKSQGYNPAKKSDHFYGIPMPQDDGSMYADSVGAADLYIKGLPGLFGHIVEHYLGITDPLARPHQIIYETGHNGDWLHIANPPLAAFTHEQAAKVLSKKPLLYSFDCGKTYVVFDPANPPEKLKKS